jgi:phosphoglycolate phosphatase-like HAD superfamily hydrolase
MLDHSKNNTKLHKFFQEKLGLDPRALLDIYYAIARINGSNHDAHLNNLYHRLGLSDDIISYQQWVDEYVKLGVSTYHQKRDEKKTFNENLAGLITKLKHMDIKLGVVSCARTREKQLYKLEMVGLKQFFNEADIIVVESETRDESEKYGNKAEGLAHLLNIKDIWPQYAVYVGDSKRDHEATQQVGMRFLFHPMPNGKHAIKYLRELENISKEDQPAAYVPCLEEDVLHYVAICNNGSKKS